MKKWLPVIALLLLIGLGVFLMARPEEAPFGAPEDATPPAYEMLYERDITRFGSLTVSAKGFEPFTVISDCVYDESGALMGVRNDLQQPILLESRESFPFHSYGYQMIMLIAQRLPVTRTLPDAGSLSDYGLDAPDATLTFTYEGGDEMTLALGSLTPDGTGCYLTLDGGSTVYIAPSDLYVTFTGGLDALHRAVATLGFDKSAVTALTIEKKGAQTLEIARKQGGASVVPFRLISPFEHDISSERLENVLGSLCAALPTAYAGFIGGEQDLAKYGLKEPSARFTLIISDKYLAQIVIGDDCEGGMAYMTVDRSGEVYKAPKERLDFLGLATADYLLDQYISLIEVTSLDSLTITAGGTTRELSLVWGEDKVYADEYLLDNKPVSREEFTKLYQSVIGLLFDKIAESEPPANEAVLGLRFKLLDGSARELEFIDYDDYYYLAVKDGEGRFLIRREKVDSVINGLV